MGELLCPCLVQGSVGVVYPVRPQEEQPQWRGSSGNLDSAPAGTPSAGPGGSGAGPLICSAGAGASLLSWALPASACPGVGGILGCVPAPCALAPVLLDSRSRPAAPSAEPPPEPLRAAPVPPCALQPLGSSARSPGRRCLLVSPGARGHPRPPGSCSTSLEPLSAQEGRCSSCVAGTGLPCTGDTRPGLSPAPRGAPPPWRPFVSFFFPIFLP